MLLFKKEYNMTVEMPASGAGADSEVIGGYKDEHIFPQLLIEIFSTDSSS
jgi:hypothetical protein